MLSVPSLSLILLVIGVALGVTVALIAAGGALGLALAHHLATTQPVALRARIPSQRRAEAPVPARTH